MVKCYYTSVVSFLLNGVITLLHHVLLHGSTVPAKEDIPNDKTYDFFPMQKYKIPNSLSALMVMLIFFDKEVYFIFISLKLLG